MMPIIVWSTANDFRHHITDLPPEQNGRYFADNIFIFIFLKEIVWISLMISLKFVPKGPIDSNAGLADNMAWRRIGDKPFSEPVLTRFTDAYMHHLGLTKLQIPEIVLISNNSLKSDMSFCTCAYTAENPPCQM